MVGRSATAATSAPKVRPCSTKGLCIKGYELDYEWRLDSGAVPSLTYEKFRKMLSLRFIRRSIGLTIGGGQRDPSSGAFSGVPIPFDSTHVALELYLKKLYRSISPDVSLTKSTGGCTVLKHGIKKPADFIK